MSQRDIDMSFYALRERVSALLQDGRDEEALPLALRAEAEHRDRGEVPFWLACIACRLGRPDQAIAALEGGLARGLWWAEDWLREDDDLAPLRGEDRFEAIVARSLESRSAAIARLKRATFDAAGVVSGGLLRSPAGPPANRPTGALVALHGWGQRASDTGNAWQAVLDEGLLLLAPESSQLESVGFHVWTDRAAADADVAAAYASLRAAHDVDERRLVAGGFSQGGGLAVSCALTGEVLPAAGFIAFGAGVDDVGAGALEAAPEAAARGVRGALFVGAGDEDLPGARQLHERLTAGGVACSFEVLPGLGHELPDDPAPLIRDALRSILAES